MKGERRLSNHLPTSARVVRVLRLKFMGVGDRGACLRGTFEKKQGRHVAVDLPTVDSPNLPLLHRSSKPRSSSGVIGLLFESLHTAAAYLWTFTNATLLRLSLPPPHVTHLHQVSTALPASNVPARTKSSALCEVAYVDDLQSTWSSVRTSSLPSCLRATLTTPLPETHSRPRGTRSYSST